VSHFNRTAIGKPEQWLIEAAASIGLDFSKFIHETTDDFVSHSIKRHGDPKTHGAATITIADFERISDIVKTPDYAIIGSIRKETLLNTYVKIYSGITYLYFEEVLISRRNKALRGKTLYKITKPLILDEIIKRVTKNDKTDISKAKILSLKNVQTAGGHPGG
jgi:hypothetical protein